MRYSQEQMRSFYQQWQQSGLARKAFCQQHNLSYATFNYWHKRLDGAKPSETGGFTAFNLPSSPSCNFEVIFSSGSRIVFHQEPSAAWLRELLG